MKRIIGLILLAVASFGVTGCGDYGQVEQGRTVKYDPQTRQVTILKDNGIDDKNPQYTVLPPHTFALPDVASETGPTPKAGLRVKLDLDKKILTMLNPKTEQFEDISFEIEANHTGVDLAKEHPLVFDAATNKPRVFPKVDKAAETVTVYSRRQHTLTTIKLPTDILERYSEKDFDAGDEVRIYYHDPKKALRYMNVTETNIFKK